MSKNWIAIDLKDFHSTKKQWQGGKEDTVKIRILGAKNLEKAKQCAIIENDNSWLVFPLNSTKNIAYKGGTNEQ
jgi:hypothetical protein